MNKWIKIGGLKTHPYFCFNIQMDCDLRIPTSTFKTFTTRIPMAAWKRMVRRECEGPRGKSYQTDEVRRSQIRWRSAMCFLSTTLEFCGSICRIILVNCFICFFQGCFEKKLGHVSMEKTETETTWKVWFITEKIPSSGNITVGVQLIPTQGTSQ